MVALTLILIIACKKKVATEFITPSVQAVHLVVVCLTFSYARPEFQDTQPHVALGITIALLILFSASFLVDMCVSLPLFLVTYLVTLNFTIKNEAPISTC